MKTLPDHRAFYRRLLNLLTIALLLTLFSSCNVPTRDDVENGADKDAVGTAAARTVEAQMRRFTATALALPSDTPIPLFSPSPTLADFTLTPTIAQGPTIVANADTNCREGPDTAYLRVGMLLANQTSTVRGRNADSSWWYIDNPNVAGGSCWVWGGSTSVQGNANNLPVITALPLPATVMPTYGGAGVEVSFSTVVPCGDDSGMVTFFAKNTGSIELKSMDLTIKEIRGDVTLYSGVVNSPFMPWLNDCQGSITLAPGKTAYFGGIILPPIPWKQKGRAIIRLCTDLNGLGECPGFRLEFYFE